MAVLPDLALPPSCDLWDSCVIRVTAIDPTTGLVVSGVTVDEVTYQVSQLSGAPIKIEIDAPLLAHEPGTNP